MTAPLPLPLKHWEARASRMKLVDAGEGLLRPVNAAGLNVNYSHSFGSTWRDCNLKAWFQKVAAASGGGSSEAADRGNRIHALNEYFGKHGEWPPQDYEVQMRFGPAQKVTKLDWLCAKASKSYIPMGPGVHHELEVRLDRVFSKDGVALNLAGYIDVVSFKAADTPAGVRPNWLGVTDYKTRGNFGYAPKTAQLPWDPQLGKYVAMAVYGSPFSPWYGTDEHPEYAVVSHVNIGTKTIEVDHRQAVMPWANVEKIWEDTNTEAEALIDLCKVDKVMEVPYTTASCGKYGGCDFASICPRSPKNRRRSGGSLFAIGGATKATTKPKSKEPVMNMKERIAARKAKAQGKSAPAKPKVETPRPPRVRRPKPAKPKMSVADKIAAKKAAKSRPQVADAGVQPEVTDPLVKDTVKVAKHAAGENDLPLDADMVQYAAGETGLDLEADGVLEALAALLPDVDLYDLGYEAGDPADSLADAEEAKALAAEDTAEDTTVVESDATAEDITKWNTALAKVAKHPGVNTDVLESIRQLGFGSDAARAGALAAIFAETIRDGAPVPRKRACKEARIAYNGMQAGYPSFDFSDSVKKDGVVKIGRFTDTALKRALEGFEGITFDEDADVVICPLLQGGGDEESPSGDTSAVEEDPDLPTTDTITVEPAHVPSVMRQRMVLIGAVPLGPCEDVEDFADWLAPHIAELEEEQGGVFWNSLDYAKGPGMLANVVARHLAKEGIVALPGILTVDGRHPAWQAVRDLLGRIPGILFIQGVR